jgi:hypothetical protein
VADARVETTFGKDEILTFLTAVDQELLNQTKVILIGGAAAILAFGNNRGSIDIDTFNRVDHLEKAIEVAVKKTGLKIPFSKSNVAFAPDGFEKRLSLYAERNFKFLNIWIPESHDFVMMKITRLLTRDLNDIVDIHRKSPLDAERLLKLYQFEMSSFVGSREHFEGNYLHVIDTLFGTKVYKNHAAKIPKR